MARDTDGATVSIRHATNRNYALRIVWFMTEIEGIFDRTVTLRRSGWQARIDEMASV